MFNLSFLLKNFKILKNFSFHNENACACSSTNYRFFINKSPQIWSGLSMIIYAHICEIGFFRKYNNNNNNNNNNRGADEVLMNKISHPSAARININESIHLSNVPFISISLSSTICGRMYVFI